MYADTPAIDSGVTIAQFFVGCDSMVCDVYGIKSDKQFVNTLEDNIHECGAPTKLISDCAQVEISEKVQDILCTLFIGSWQSEPHQQHQNPAEHCFQTVKTTANTILDHSGAPACTWLLCLLYVCFLLNHTFCTAINCVPLQHANGSTVDISPLLCFHFWELVYYKIDDSDFPSDSCEALGHMVGIAENVGHAMTYKVLTVDTQKVIYCSNLCSASPTDPNWHVALVGGETPTPSVPPPSIVKSHHDHAADGETTNHNMPIFSPIDLVGRTFLMEPREDGQRFRARIVKAIEGHDDELTKHPDHLKFLCSVNDDTQEEIMSYNDILAHIQQDEESTIIWKFKRITAHEGPLKPNHPNYKGSTYNVMVEWEDGEITSEPLGIIAADDPVTCALYAKEHDLLDLDGWKRFRGIAKHEKKLFCMANQAKLCSYHTAPKYKYGYEVPRDYSHAVQIDKKCGNTKWQDATKLERQSQDEYKTFEDWGYKAEPPKGYKKIRVHLVFDVKHDGRHKAWLVADGHLTDIPLESVYSGVVSLQGLRLVLFLAKLNQLETWATDIGNAYLEAETKEKVYIIAGPEFGELEGHILIICKALYGLQTSGLHWHECFADCLCEMGFAPSKAKPDIWMQHMDDKYEYIAVYVDDLAIAAKNPREIVDTLLQHYKFKLKGTGPIAFHLGMDFSWDEYGVMCLTPRKYIEKMCTTFEQLFGHPPKQPVTSPIEKNDHPELDVSELLNPEETVKYQSLIGALQWAVSIGQFDIMTAVMTLSSFHAAPCQGHMDCVKCIYSYLAKMKSAAICI